MANQIETSTFTPNIYEIGVGDPVGGGPSAVVNVALSGLTDRTRWLYDENGARAAEILSLQNGGFQGVTNSIVSGLLLSQTGSYPSLTVTVAAGLVATMTNGYDATTGREQRITIKTTTSLSVVCPGGGAIVLQINQGGVPELVYVESIEVTALQPTKVTPWLWHDYVENTCSMNTGGFFGNRFACVVAYLEDLDAVRPAAYRTSIFDHMTPTGSVMPFIGTRTPVGGWIEANGNSVAITEHPNLFWFLYDFGGPIAPVATPDLRGEFVRGLDSGRGIDAGRAIGTFQADEFKSHQHEIVTEYNTANGGSARLTWSNGTGTVYNMGTSITGGTETRPRNVALKYWIKL